MPVDTFAIPFGPQQQDSAAQEASAPGYYARRDFEANQQVTLQENDPSHHMTDREIEVDAMLSPEQRAQRLAEEEARIDLGNEEYNPDYFENINRAAREERLAEEAHSYYGQRREIVAAPQASQPDNSVTYEKVEQWAKHPEVNLPHLGHIGQLVKAKRDDFVRAA